MADWASKAPDYSDNKSKRKSAKDKKQSQAKRKSSSWNRSWKPAPTDIQGAVFGITTLPQDTINTTLPNSKQQYDTSYYSTSQSRDSVTVHHDDDVFSEPAELIGLEEENDEILLSVYGPSEQLEVKLKSHEPLAKATTKEGSNLAGDSSSSASINSLPDDEEIKVVDSNVPQLLAYAEGTLTQSPNYLQHHEVADSNSTSSSDSNSSKSSSSENESEDNEEDENETSNRIQEEYNVSINVDTTDTLSPDNDSVIAKDLANASEDTPTDESMGNENATPVIIASQISLPNETSEALVIHAEVPPSSHQEPLLIINDNTTSIADNNPSVVSEQITQLITSEQDQLEEIVQHSPIINQEPSNKENATQSISLDLPIDIGVDNDTVSPTVDKPMTNTTNNEATDDTLIDTSQPITTDTSQPSYETPINETPINETPINGTPINETPINGAPINETPINETPINETPINETPINGAPINETPINETPINETPIYTKTTHTTTNLSLTINEVKTTKTKISLTIAPIDTSNDSTTKSYTSQQPTESIETLPLYVPTTESSDVRQETPLEHSTPTDSYDRSSIKTETSETAKLNVNNQKAVVTEKSTHSTKEAEITPTMPTDVDTVPLLAAQKEEIAIEIESEPPAIEPWMMNTYLGIFDDFNNDQEPGNTKEKSGVADDSRGWRREVKTIKTQLCQCFTFCNKGYDFNTKKLEDNVDYNVAPIARKPITAIQAYRERRQQTTENNPLIEAKDTITGLPVDPLEEIKLDDPQITNDDTNNEIKNMIAQSANDDQLTEATKENTESANPSSENLETNETKPKPKFSESIETMFSFFDRLGGARSVGVKAMQTSLSNIYTNTPFGNIARHISVYGGFILTFAFFIIAIVSFTETQETKKDCTKDNCKNRSNVLGIFEILFSLIGFLFTIYDTFVHTKKTFEKCVCDKIESTSTGDCYHKMWNDSKMKSASKAATMAYHCACCPKRVVMIMDIIRMFVMDAMFYPALVLSIFSLCSEIAHEGKASALSWILAVIGFLGDFLTVYLVRLFILLGSIYSIARVRNINKAYDYKDMFKGALFQVTFVAYSLGVMILQIMIIIFMGDIYYIQYKNKCGKDCQKNKPTIFDVNYKPSFEFIYLFCYGYFLPMIATIMFFTIHKFWTTKFPLEFIADIIGTFSNSSFDATDMLVESDRKDFTQEFKTKTENTVKFLAGGKFSDEIKKMKSTSLFDQLIYPLSSPLPVILCIVNVAMICMSFDFMIKLYNTTSGAGLGLAMIILFSLLAMTVNVYSLIVVFFWIYFLYAIIYGLFHAILIIVAIWFFYACIGSSSRSRRRYHRYV